MIEFIKMHGCGNDFVIIDARNQDVNLNAEQIRQICDRNFGVGCDLMTILHESENADIKVLFFNADGSESDACGNATRCVADIILKETGQSSGTIETGRGLLAVERVGSDLIKVDMGEPQLEWDQIPLREQTDTLKLPIEGNPVAVGMGNPHCVLFVDNVVDINLDTIGPLYENHDFYPERTNVEFVEKIGENKLRQRTWERGAGETLACGSGACAVAVGAVRRELTDRTVEIRLDGGTLHIEWNDQDNHVYMTGPYAYVFEGALDV